MIRENIVRKGERVLGKKVILMLSRKTTRLSENIIGESPSRPCDNRHCTFEYHSAIGI
jgi:hypothetical protein